MLPYACNNPTKTMQYKLTQLQNEPPVTKDWDATVWNNIDPLVLTNYMGDKPEHFPDTQVKLAYDDNAIYVNFRVEDQYVKAIYNRNQDPVYKDSCVEFFFTPGENVDSGYFNLEMNCGGTMLFHHQIVPRKKAVKISETDIGQIEVIASLPEIVNPEISQKLYWQVSYRIPFSILKNYHEFSQPHPGTIWRANFYKCADETSHPHWLTWAPIDLPTPDFHRPEFFGELRF